MAIVCASRWPYGRSCNWPLCVRAPKTACMCALILSGERANGARRRHKNAGRCMFVCMRAASAQIACVFYKSSLGAKATAIESAEHKSQIELGKRIAGKLSTSTTSAAPREASSHCKAQYSTQSEREKIE